MDFVTFYDYFFHFCCFVRYNGYTTEDFEKIQSRSDGNEEVYHFAMLLHNRWVSTGDQGPIA